MSYRPSFFLYHKCRNVLLQESRRYAGHSKWQNIKHTKQQNDSMKSTTFRMIINKMKLAVQESGVADPSNNVKLSQLVTEAKKVNMPAATLNAALNRLKDSKKNAKPDMFVVRSPGSALLVLHVFTNSVPLTRGEINSKLKKHNSKFVDPATLRAFDCFCYITATKDCNVDQAMEDAITINVEDVEEVQEDDQTFFMFKTEFGSSMRYISQLKNMGYTIVAMEDMCIPRSTVELSESDLKNVNELKKKLSTVSDIEKIDDNILEA